eukprot:gene9022-biopygen9224
MHAADRVDAADAPGVIHPPRPSWPGRPGRLVGPAGLGWLGQPGRHTWHERPHLVSCEEYTLIRETPKKTQLLERDPPFLSKNDAHKEWLISGRDDTHHFDGDPHSPSRYFSCSRPLSRGGGRPLSRGGGRPLSRGGGRPLSRGGGRPLSRGGTTPADRTPVFPSDVCKRVLCVVLLRGAGWGRLAGAVPGTLSGLVGDPGGVVLVCDGLSAEYLNPRLRNNTSGPPQAGFKGGVFTAICWTRPDASVPSNSIAWDTAENACGTRPGRVPDAFLPRSFEFHRVGRVRDASVAVSPCTTTAARDSENCVATLQENQRFICGPISRWMHFVGTPCCSRLLLHDNCASTVTRLLCDHCHHGSHTQRLQGNGCGAMGTVVFRKPVDAPPGAPRCTVKGGHAGMQRCTVRPLYDFYTATTRLQYISARLAQEAVPCLSFPRQGTTRGNDRAAVRISADLGGLRSYSP